MASCQPAQPAPSEGELNLGSQHVPACAVDLPHPAQVPVEAARLHEERQRLLVEAWHAATAEPLLLDDSCHDVRWREHPSQPDGGCERLADRSQRDHARRVQALQRADRLPVAGVGFGILFIALAQISDGAGLLPLAANQLCGAILTIVAGAGLRQVWPPSPGVLGWGSVSGVFGASGTLAFVVATGATSLGIAGVLTSLYPAVTVLLAAGLLRERVAVGQRVGIGICTLAVAAMALG